MGIGYECICGKCGYSFDADLGVGFMFPTEYDKEVTAMKNGKHGRLCKDFFELNPDGAIDCEYTVAQCVKCGELMQVKDLSMYIPKDSSNADTNEKRRWSVAFPFEGASYYTKEDLKDRFVLYKKFEHRCSKCRGRAEVIENIGEKLQQGQMNCPKCGEMMAVIDAIKWD